MRLSPNCPILAVNTGDTDPLLVEQVVRGLSSAMEPELDAADGPLTDARIAEIVQEEVGAWGPSEEAATLTAYPDLAAATHDCEALIREGQCAVYALARTA